jgi:2-keto-4-pentenoate hydratase/2-oxohepta-3-ene-1,7-dioic acid hydratase in catechol pathway
MRIARFSTQGNGNASWGVLDLDRGTVRPVRGSIREWGPALTRNGGGEPAPAGEELELDAIRLLAPVEPGSKVIAAGATYAKHVAGLGLQMPKQPGVFLKTVASLVGPDEEIGYHPLTSQLDYEGELVVVIGAEVSGGGAAAVSSILGYTVGNEVSARDLQFGGAVTGMDTFSGKALDGTGPIGPWIVTRDEFGDESPDLALELAVDGEVRQSDRTGSLVWGVGEIVSYVSERSTLQPGDILFTGTPHGVGHEDGRYLEPGQEVVVTIERVGTLRNRVGPRRAG